MKIDRVLDAQDIPLVLVKSTWQLPKRRIECLTYCGVMVTKRSKGYYAYHWRVQGFDPTETNYDEPAYRNNCWIDRRKNEDVLLWSELPQTEK